MGGVRFGVLLTVAALAPGMPAGAQEATSSTQGASSLSAAGNLATPGTGAGSATQPSLPSLKYDMPDLPYAGAYAGVGRTYSPSTAPVPSATTAPASLVGPPAPRFVTPAPREEQLAAAAAARAPGAAPTELPRVTGEPLRIDFADDPVLRFAKTSAPPDQFKLLVGRAVEGHAAVAEAEAAARGAGTVVSQARSGLFPTVDLSFTGDRSLSRDFGNDNNSVIERVRPHGRTDANATVTQTLLDFGGTARRIKAAQAREDAAEAEVQSAADDVAVRAISAWYDLAAYRALVAMGEALKLSQDELTAAVRERIHEGVSAETDLPRVATYTSSADARLAQYRRALAGAEARYTETIGLPAPAQIGRPVLPIALPQTVEEARIASHATGQVRSADAQVRAAEADYRATVADNLPRVQAVIDAGRYGVFETSRDYDVRGRLVLRHRLLGGGGSARKNEAEQRYLQARAGAERIAEEAERDAAITFTDLKASDQEVAALEQAYVANRQSRDAIAERFRVTQGSLMDVLNAEDTYFQVAAQYIEAVVRRDAQRLVLAQRGGQLLDALGVELPEHER